MLNQPYLLDEQFLYQIDDLNLKNQFIKIIVLSYQDETIQEIQGKILAGNISNDNKSRIRRTLSLSMSASSNENNLTNIQNIISINKKIKILIGYQNPLVEYQKYGKIIWFNQGIFVISEVKILKNDQGYNIQISGKDKMVLLDGSCGGIIPANTVFHEIYEKKDNGEIQILRPTLYQIIVEAVHHFGEQPIHKIIINGLKQKAKVLVKYMGDTPIYFSENYGSFIIGTLPEEKRKDYPNKFSYGEDVGYLETDLAYPKELVLAPGSSVCDLLDKICELLGNFEYFFNLQGDFIFREIKNYYNTSYSSSVFETKDQNKTILPLEENRYKYSLTSKKQIFSFSRDPKYSNIKNDFVIWGNKISPMGEKTSIRYHLVIKNKPILNLSHKFMWKILADNSRINRYEYSYNQSGEDIQLNPGETKILIGIPGQEWREELYRQALERKIHAVTSLFLDEELISEWRHIYNPLNKEWKERWQKLYPQDEWQGWNPEIKKNPNSLNYWLDFIDYDNILNQYSIDRIGRRSKIINDGKIKSIYNYNPPDVIFIPREEENKKKVSEILKNFSPMQKCCVLSQFQMNYFATSSTGKSCVDIAKDLISRYVIYNDTISISCTPKYYLEPNDLIYVEDKESNIRGEYLISSFNIPLKYSETMTINAIENKKRI